MRTLVGGFLFCLFVLAAAAIVLALGWLLSLPVRWLCGFDAFQSYALAMGALVAVIGFGAMISRSSWEIPWISDEYEEDASALDTEELKSAQPATWFSPCPCGSDKPFARCCGKRAFKKHGT